MTASPRRRTRPRQVLSPQCLPNVMVTIIFLLLLANTADWNRYGGPPLVADALVLPAPQHQSMVASRLPTSSRRRLMLHRSLSSSTPNQLPSSSTSTPSRLLAQDEERSLLSKMHDPSTRDTLASRAARQELLLHNLPLVRSIVTKTQRTRRRQGHHPCHFSGGGGTGSATTGAAGAAAALTPDDLLHEGTIGLAEAIDRHDPKRDTRLSTYATYWIRARILRAVQSRGEHTALRFPEYALQASHRLARAARTMGLEWEDVVDMMVLVGEDHAGEKTRMMRDRLCDEANIPRTGGLFGDAVRIRCMTRYGGQTRPLESWMTTSVVDDNDGIGVDNGCCSQTAISGEAGGQGGRHIVETLSKFLVPREIEVLSLRYGLVSPAPLSNKEEAEADVGRVPQPTFRDYEADAMDGLFGPCGMLSHYADAPTEDRLSTIAMEAATTTSASSIAAQSSTSSPTISHKGRESLVVLATTTTTTKITMPTKPKNGAALLSFKEIGKRLKFSGEYCRRTCTVALKKLTRAVEEGRLAESDFLLGW